MRPGRTTEEAEAALKEEIEKVKKEPVSERELEKTRNQVESGFIMGQDSVFYQAMFIGRLETTGAGYKYIDNYINEIGNVTAEDIMRVAQKYFLDDNKTVGVLVPLPPKQ